jgi:hypothetical protein
LHSVWKCYLLPFGPGFAATFAVTAVFRGVHTRLILLGVGLVVLYAFIWRLNESAARKLGRKIQDLRRMEASDE